MHALGPELLKAPKQVDCRRSGMSVGFASGLLTFDAECLVSGGKPTAF
jgi:hypothetical protein